MAFKNAQSVSQKYVNNASAATGDYQKGINETTVDPTALAAAAATRAAAAIAKSFSSGRWAANLARAGKSKWQANSAGKGAERFSGGVSSAMGVYATNSGAYDQARASAASLPRGDKGSQTNLDRVKAVVNALRTKKVGSAA